MRGVVLRRLAMCRGQTIWILSALVIAGCAVKEYRKGLAGGCVKPPVGEEQSACRDAGATGLKTGCIPGQKPGEVVTGEAWVIAKKGDGKYIDLRLANHGSVPLHMSFVVDEYVVKSASGRTDTLEKTDMFQYPELLIPGDERSVKLLLPRSWPTDDLTQLIARINDGRTSLVLTPLASPPSSEIEPAADSPSPETPALDSAEPAAPSNTRE